MEQSELPELTPETIEAVVRIMGLFVIAGLLVGVAGLIATDWLLAMFGEELIADWLSGFMAMIAALVIAPPLAAALGLYEGRRGVNRRLLGEVGIGVWVGSVFYGILVLVLIGFSVGDVGPAYIEYLSIAGLVSIGAVLSGVAGAASQDLVEGADESAESRTVTDTDDTTEASADESEETPFSTEAESEPEETVEPDEGSETTEVSEAGDEGEGDDDSNESPFEF